MRLQSFADSETRSYTSQCTARDQCDSYPTTTTTTTTAKTYVRATGKTVSQLKRTSSTIC